jgi:hypothetical protein
MSKEVTNDANELWTAEQLEAQKKIAAEHAEEIKKRTNVVPLTRKGRALSDAAGLPYEDEQPKEKDGTEEVVEELLKTAKPKPESKKDEKAKVEVTPDNAAGVQICDQLVLRNNVTKGEKKKVAEIRGRLLQNNPQKDDREFLKEMWCRRATADLSLQARTYDRERPVLEKTIASLQSMGIRFSYDLFRKRYLVGDHALKERFGSSTDNAILVLRTHITEKLGFDPRGFTTDAVQRLCLENAFNPVLDYLDGLKWDGKPRLDTWLSTYLSAMDGPLTQQFGRKTLVAAVRRVRDPGIKFDQALVIEGEQDTGKSSTVKILGGEYYRDAPIIAKNDREVQELTCGVWLYELSELAGISKREVEHVKQFLSRTHDSARGVWGRFLEDQPRTCVFIGTCNRNDYLSDDTGNRRFWPVPTGKIDLEGLARDRDQLWAEACVVEATGEALTLDQGMRGEAAMVAASRLAEDPWDNILSRVERMPSVEGRLSIEFGERRVASDYLLKEVLDLPPSMIGQAAMKRLSACMKRVEWKGPKNMKINGQPDVKGYCKPLSECRR